MLASLYYFWQKSSRRTSRQHLLFQSLNSNTRVEYERSSRFIKIITKTKFNSCSTLDRFEQTLHLVWLFLWQFYKKQVNVQYDIGSISMSIASHIYNAANTSLQRTTAKTAKAISKNLRFSFLDNNRVREGLTEKFILAFSTTLAQIFFR